MRIICAGMVRSGSTILFNIVRLLYEHKCGASNVYGCWIKQYDKNDPRHVHIVKIHKYNEKLIDNDTLVITSRRDIRDVAASLMRKGWIRDGIIPSIEKVLDKYVAWYQHSIYDMSYEDMCQNRVEIIKEIAVALKLEISNSDVHKINEHIKSLSYWSEGKRTRVYNEITLFHKHHISDGSYGSFRGTLTNEDIAKIEHKYSEWILKEMGEDHE
jgi:hypothetical protein